MRLGNPQLLWLLVAAGVVVVAYAAAFAHRRRLVERLGDGALLARVIDASAPRRALRAAFVVVAVALLALALARPQASGRAKLTKQRGLDLVVALDFSKSMLAKDVYPSRIERAKRELERLMERLAGDRIGLVAFAGEPITYPPTTDYAAVKLFWRDLSPQEMPVGGTAIGKAIRAGVDLLKNVRRRGEESRSQVILLLTDGEDTESEPLEAAEEASRLGIKVFAVGIGSRSGELVPVLDDDGQVAGYAKGEGDGYVTSRLDEDTLVKIAGKTGGEYFAADPKRFGVEAVEGALAGLKRADNEARLVTQYDDFYWVLALPAFLLLVLEACWGERKRARRVPAPSSRPKSARRRDAEAASSAASTPAVATLVLFALVPLLGGWDLLRRPNRAVQEGNQQLKNGKAAEALAAYDRAAQALPGDPSLQFNRGAALAGMGKFEEAGAAFLKATEAKDPSIKAQAFANLGNTFYKRKQYREAIEAYKRALTLNPRDQTAKWNLELALRAKQDEQKKNDQNQDDKSQDNKNKNDDQNKQDHADGGQPREPDGGQPHEPDGGGAQGQDGGAPTSQDQEKQSEQGQQDQQGPDAGAPKPRPQQGPDGGASGQPGAIEGILDGLDQPKNLQYERLMQMRRRRPPSKDW